MQGVGTFHFKPITFYLLFLTSKLLAATDTLSPSHFLTENQTLVSKTGTFELGFFTPGNSGNRYLGIWYKDIQPQTVVWVANRETPTKDASLVLHINTPQNVVLLSHNKTVLWSVTPKTKPHKPVLQLLDSGNLVLRERHEEDQEKYLWQSFDYPCDTLLPGMKLGKDLRTGLDRRLTAWKSENDPSPGNLMWGMYVTNYPEPMQWIGSRKSFNSGPWNGVQYSGKPTLKRHPVFEFIYFSNEEEVYYMFRLWNNSVKARMVLNQKSFVRQHYVWVEEKYWKMYGSLPRDFCDKYGACGPNGKCDQGELPAFCDCLKGFKPKSPVEWSGMKYSQGCVRDGAWECRNDGFSKYVGMKVPDTEFSWLNQNMSSLECREKCLRNCSCAAYANSDIREGGSGCAMWFGDLMDLRVQPDAGQDLYVRVPASELETKNGHKVKVGIAVGSTIAILCVLLLALYFVCRRRAGAKKNIAIVDHYKEEEEEDMELPLFDLSTIASATDNFSISNKLGEGGFGPVYKGALENGQEIAVKRLSSGSGQGLKEFKNEIKLIAKLQHRNLVRLHGCCIQGAEKLLIYEYMHNKSLDFFIFDQTQRMLLDWPKCFNIICGIARGLLYLHQDSRLRIIHRDLKASNILLDSEINPKISDFGLARILCGDQNAATTHRVAGTYGYMAPEYAIDGNFSVKSDVFSFGILLLEIVSGKKNVGSNQQEKSRNLIGHAWDLWIEGRPLELISEYNTNSCNLSEALRCIHISLLCLQQHPHDRPSMSSVVMMLGSEIGLPQPKRPAVFVGEDSPHQEYSSSYKNDLHSVNELSITVLEAR
ncbi:G-type lectin S-receptor serine/threonine-protein kinase [Spatholobus suberectus]|nr:G-type lectin S-receptor serine/threonine-protein kinase [Spatholobus suberectus]